MELLRAVLELFCFINPATVLGLTHSSFLTIYLSILVWLNFLIQKGISRSVYFLKFKKKNTYNQREQNLSLFFFEDRML